MLVTLLPGTDFKNAYDNLSEVHRRVSNLRSAGLKGAYNRLLAYLEWTSEAVEALSGVVSAADLDRLVLTKRYELLLSGVGSLAGIDTQRVVSSLVSLELRERATPFNRQRRYSVAS